MEVQITDTIVAERDGNGRWYLKDTNQDLISRELFISITVMRQAVEDGYVTWELEEVEAGSEG